MDRFHRNLIPWNARPVAALRATDAEKLEHTPGVVPPTRPELNLDGDGSPCGAVIRRPDPGRSRRTAWRASRRSGREPRRRRTHGPVRGSAAQVRLMLGSNGGRQREVTSGTRRSGGLPDSGHCLLGRGRGQGRPPGIRTQHGGDRVCSPSAGGRPRCRIPSSPTTASGGAARPQIQAGQQQAHHPDIVSLGSRSSRLATRVRSPLAGLDHGFILDAAAAGDKPGGGPRPEPARGGNQADAKRSRAVCAASGAETGAGDGYRGTGQPGGQFSNCRAIRFIGATARSSGRLVEVGTASRRRPRRCPRSARGAPRRRGSPARGRTAGRPGSSRGPPAMIRVRRWLESLPTSLATIWRPTPCRRKSGCDGEVQDVELVLVQLVDHEPDDPFAVLGDHADAVALAEQRRKSSSHQG